MQKGSCCLFTQTINLQNSLELVGLHGEHKQYLKLNHSYNIIGRNIYSQKTVTFWPTLHANYKYHK